MAAMGMVPDIPGMGALDMNVAETRIVEGTREIVPGMVLAGMELSEVGASCCQVVLCHLIMLHPR